MRSGPRWPLTWLPVLITGFCAFSAGAMFAPADWRLRLRPKDPAVARDVTARSSPLAPDEQSTVDMFDRASHSVAFIASSRIRNPVVIPSTNTRLELSPQSLEDVRGHWLRNPGSIELRDRNGKATTIPLDDADMEAVFSWDSGSGIVWDDDGHIVTNYHVVEQHFDLMVRLPDLTDWPAVVVGFDEDKDLAVLRIDAPPAKLKPIALGSSRDLKVGQRVYSIGNPFGLSSTLTGGLISALGRTIRSGTGIGNIIQDVIQTDASINPGNSGGPLLDSAGRLIGVTTAIVQDSNGNSGIGFAVPVDVVNRVVPDLINFGQPVKAGLGIRVQTELAGIIDGIPISTVVPGSPADKAGLRGGLDVETLRYRDGDIITAIDGVAIHDFDDLYRVLDTHQPGDIVRLDFVRKGESLTTKLELQSLAQLRNGSREVGAQESGKG